MSLLLWWKFGAVKKILLAGKGGLYDAGSVGQQLFEVLHILTVRDTICATLEVAKGADAWELIEANPDAVSACLTCSECGFNHVIRYIPNAKELVVSCPFGQFEGDQGRWHSDWFALHSHDVRDLTIKDSLTCQSCRKSGIPTIQLY